MQESVELDKCTVKANDVLRVHAYHGLVIC